jgi:hypothetical protein
MSYTNRLGKALGICCTFALLHLNVSASGLEIATETNEEGMVDSIVTYTALKFSRMFGYASEVLFKISALRWSIPKNLLLTKMRRLLA